jgi:hypothetical protein
MTRVTTTRLKHRERNKLSFVSNLVVDQVLLMPDDHELMKMMKKRTVKRMMKKWTLKVQRRGV